jgi:cytochrome P450
MNIKHRDIASRLFTKPAYTVPLKLDQASESRTHRVLPTKQQAMVLQIYQCGLAAFAIFLLRRLYTFSKLSTRPPNFPPGPATLPFIGNLHQIPTSRPQFKFSDYARQFGAIVGLKLGCQSMIVLNTWQAVRDLVEQKGAIYSSRPHIPIVDIVTPGNLNPALSVYGDTWRRQRKMLVELLGGEKTDGMKPVQDAESTQMLYDIMNDPAHFENHVLRSFGAVILATVYGQRGKTLEKGGKLDTFFTIEEDWSEAVAPAKYPPTNSFPFLHHVPEWMTPWKGWKSRALRIKETQNGLYKGLLRETKERLKEGKGTKSFIAQCLEVQDKEWYDDTYLAYFGGVLLEGGAETSASTTMTFIMTMAGNPDVLKKAQEEVDQVIGRSRLPGKDDTGSLPFIRACMLEINRWRPVTVLALPHSSIADDTYGSYSIPKDSDVIINAWQINHEPSFYDNPDTFNPERYLDNEYGAQSSIDPATYERRRINYTFGAGRRVCPGQRFAENTMIMHFAKLVWAFDIKAMGKLPLDSLDGWTDGIMTRPKDFKNVKMALRDEGRRPVIESAWLEADEFLREFE